MVDIARGRTPRVIEIAQALLAELRGMEVGWIVLPTLILVGNLFEGDLAIAHVEGDRAIVAKFCVRDASRGFMALIDEGANNVQIHDDFGCIPFTVLDP